jgi:ABC-2 type transport system ATP-binding protein
LLGAEVPGGLPTTIARVGSIVEAPALFPRFSGRRNLELLGRLQGIGPRAVTAMLERVGLAERANDAVKTYSLGMKQRLGIGAALLKDPALLILDEPANGLDPAGIVEVRELLQRLGSEGRTVFVSSHILSEVQHVADRVAILTRGRCVKAGAVADVLSGGRSAGVVARLDDLQAGLRALAEAGLAATVETDHLRVEVPPLEAARVTRALADRGLYLSELRRDEQDLERVFLELTSDEAPSP